MAVEVAADVRFHQHRCPDCAKCWKMCVWPGTRCRGRRVELCPVCAAARGKHYCGEPGAELPGITLPGEYALKAAAVINQRSF